MSSLLMQSCLDFDVTGTEFNQTTKNEEKVTRQGAVDSIDYKATITQEEFAEVMEKCNSNISQALGGVFAMRGGKNGERPGTHQYQYQFSFGPDMYAQYGIVPHVNYPYSGINLTNSFAIDLKAYGGSYGSFVNVEKAMVPLLNMKEVDKLPEIKAIFLLLYDYSAVEVADIYGPMPYQDLKTNKQKHPYSYDGLETIYNTVIANIDTVVNCFDNFKNKEEWYRTGLLKTISRNVPLSKELMMGGAKDLDAFKRLANSLKLRMAMHIVKRDKNLAKKWAEEAVASGVIEEAAQEMALYPSMLSINHPMVELWNSWNDMRMAAGFQQVIEGMEHPYKDVLFMNNEEILKDVMTGEVGLKANTKPMGIRLGTHVDNEQGKTTNRYNQFSKINADYIQQAPLYIMKYSEVCFLRAEGAVRGWNMKGAAKDFYEAGIRYGDCQDRERQLPEYEGLFEKKMEAYLQKDAATPFTYVDPTGDTPDIKSDITIGVKWNEGDAPEVKLEKIITQKYIAGFPYSFEAWVDLRRTGYPRLFPGLYPGDGDGSLHDGDMIRRMPFPDTSDQSVLQDVLSTGMKALGGADKQATRLWWDVDAPNF